MPRYEFQEGTSSKFWEIELRGKSFTTKFGKIGSTGQTKLKDCANEGAAKAAYDKLIAEKTNKGYQLVGKGPKTIAPKQAKAPAITHARDAKLEAAIIAAPDDADAYLVYADWLQAHGDPRGELIVLQHANKAAAAKKLLQQHAAHFFGKLADAQDLLAPSAHHRPIGRKTTWRWGYLEAVWIGNKHDRSADYGGGVDLEEIAIADALGWLLDHPSGRFLRELTVGINTFIDNGYADIAKVLGKRALPTLTKLVLGDFGSDETELNWSDMGNVEPMYKAMPNLASLTLRSGSMKLGKIDLPRLKELVVLTGGLDKTSLANICNARWPNLETLRVQTGDDGNIDLKHLQPIFDGKAFPKVRHLGLGNSPFADAICHELARSKIAAQLESLDLSQGTLGDEGAAALAAGTWPRLSAINVDESWLTKKGIASLKTIAKAVNTGGRYGQQDDEGDPDNRYIAGRE